MRDLQVIREKPAIIEPAAATPNETLFFSNVDQQAFFHVDLMFVYDVGDVSLTGDAVDVLRGALSKVLVPYYFAAGRFQLNEVESRIELNCNAAGALFAGAYCDSTIEDLGDLRVWHLERKKLMFFPSDIKEIGDIPPVAIQVTRFKCGGVVVGMLCSHAMFDGVSGASFFNAFALYARGGSLPKEEWPSPDRSVMRARNPPRPSREHPELVSLPDIPARLFFNSGTSGIFPPRGGIAPESESGEDKKIRSRTFVFTPTILSKLKNSAMEDGTLAKCSSFEALTAHLWKAKALCLRDLEVPEKITNLIIPVNIRPRLKMQPLPKNFIGNGIAYAACADTSIEQLCTRPLSFCTMKVQQAIAAVDEEYVHSQLDWCEANKYGTVNFLGGMLVTSLDKLPLHEADFGWGKPKYVMPAPSEFEMCEYVQLLSRCVDDEGGVDVILRMYSDKMPMLEELMALN